jgi:hypothetical protein
MTRRQFAGLLAAAAGAPESWPISHRHDHVQGLDVSREWFWISAVDRRTKTGWVWRVDRRTGKTAAERDITQGARYHPGGLQVAGGSLRIPNAEYRPRSRARILKLDPLTLAERSSFAVDDHIGALATDGRTFVLGANWDARRFYRWTPEGKLLASAGNPGPLAVQDMKWVRAELWAGGLAAKRCRLERLDPETYRPIKTVPLPEDLCYTHEGMTLFEGRFYFLPEDEPRSRIYAIRPKDD